MIYLFRQNVNNFRQKREKELIIIDRLFIADVARELKLRKWTQQDLANATGLKLSYIKAVMGEQRRCSEEAKKVIAQTLGIKV